MNVRLVARIFPSRYMMAESALMRRVTASAAACGQLDEDVLEAGAGDFDSEHAAEAAEVRDEVEHAAFLFADRDHGRVLRHLDAQSGDTPRLPPRASPRELGERHRDLVQPSGQHLQGVDVAARGLAARAHDEDVVAQRFRFAENLRRQHDRPAARRLPPQPAMTDRFRIGSMPGRELVEKDDRRVDHEHLGHLDAAFEAAAQIHHLAVGFGAKLELIEHVFGRDRGWLRGDSP